jgi:hypothetical protein
MKRGGVRAKIYGICGIRRGVFIQGTEMIYVALRGKVSLRGRR